MDHNDVRHKLSEYIDGSAADDERAAIEAHLKTCAQCSQALSELRKTIEHIKTVEEIEPPAWMMQKIMANVRAEAANKGWFERIFLPFSIKFPIQAVAVVFLAVTAFYIYRNIQPAPSPSETPIQEFAAKEEAERDRLAKAQENTLRAKQAPQAPEYKALDMKPEYEKPAAPRPVTKAEAPVPAPAKTAEQFMPAKEEAVGERYAAAPQAGAPAAAKAFEPAQPANKSQNDALSLQSQAFGDKREATESAPGLMREGPRTEGMARASKKAKTALAVGDVENAVAVTMKVKEFDTASKEIEKTVTAFGGRIIRTVPTVDKGVLMVSINSDKFTELLAKLKTIGEVKEKVSAPVGSEGSLTIRITMTKN